MPGPPQFARPEPASSSRTNFAPSVRQKLTRGRGTGGGAYPNPNTTNGAGGVPKSGAVSSSPPAPATTAARSPARFSSLRSGPGAGRQGRQELPEPGSPPLLLDDLPEANLASSARFETLQNVPQPAPEAVSAQVQENGNPVWTAVRLNQGGIEGQGLGIRGQGIQGQSLDKSSILRTFMRAVDVEDGERGRDAGSRDDLRETEGRNDFNSPVRAQTLGHDHDVEMSSPLPNDYVNSRNVGPVDAGDAAGEETQRVDSAPENPLQGPPDRNPVDALAALFQRRRQQRESGPQPLSTSPPKETESPVKPAVQQSESSSLVSARPSGCPTVSLEREVEEQRLLLQHKLKQLDHYKSKEKITKIKREIDTHVKSETERLEDQLQLRLAGYIGRLDG